MRLGLNKTQTIKWDEKILSGNFFSVQLWKTLVVEEMWISLIKKIFSQRIFWILSLESERWIKNRRWGNYMFKMSRKLFDLSWRSSFSFWTIKKTFIFLILSTILSKLTKLEYINSHWDLRRNEYNASFKMRPYVLKFMNEMTN